MTLAGAGLAESGLAASAESGTSASIAAVQGSANILNFIGVNVATDSITAAVQPAANRAYVDIGTPAAGGDRITATPVDLVTGDQVAYDTRLFASDGVTPTTHTVSIDSTGVYTLTASGPSIPDGTYYIKDIRVFDISDNSWGGLQDQLVYVRSNYQYITFDGSTPIGQGLYQKTIDLFGVTPVLGDGWLVEIVSGVTFTSDGNFEVDPPTSGQFDFMFWDDSVGEYSETARYVYTDSGYSSSLDVTLEDVTSTITADAFLLSSLNRVLSPVTSTASGSIRNLLNMNPEAGSVQSVATGTVTVTGSVSVSTEDVVLFSAQINTGTSNVTLDDISGSGTGNVLLSGSINSNLERVNVSSSGNLSSIGTINTIVGGVTSTSTVTISTSGSISETLEDVTSFTGALVLGSSSPTLEDVEVGFTASVTNLGDLSVTLDNVSGISGGDVRLSAEINSILEDITSSVSGSVTMDATIEGYVEDVEIATSSFPEILTVVSYLVYLLEDRLGV